MSAEKASDCFSEVGSHIDACIEIIKQPKNTDCFPNNGNFLPRLMLIQKSIESASKSLDENSSSDASNAVINYVLKGCIERAKSLHEMFKCMASTTGPTEVRKNIKEMRTASKATQLIDKIIKDLEVVSDGETNKADKKVLTEASAEDTYEKKRDEKDQGGNPSVPNQAPGPEKLYDYNGIGNQNIANDKAAQVTGTVSESTFNFHC